MIKIKYAQIDCSYGGLGAIVDCEDRMCFLCHYHTPLWWREQWVSPQGLKDMIASFRYVIRVLL